MRVMGKEDPKPKTQNPKPERFNFHLYIKLPVIFKRNHLNISTEEITFPL